MMLKKTEKSWLEEKKVSFSLTNVKTSEVFGCYVLIKSAVVSSAQFNFLPEKFRFLYEISIHPKSRLVLTFL